MKCICRKKLTEKTEMLGHKGYIFNIEVIKNLVFSPHAAQFRITCECGRIWRYSEDVKGVWKWALVKEETMKRETMKVICRERDLRKAMSKLKIILLKKTYLTTHSPLQNSLLLETENGNLVLTATDFETMIKYTIPCSVLKEGWFILSNNKLPRLVKLLPKSEVKIEALEGNKMCLQSGKFKGIFKSSRSLPFEDFLSFEKGKKEYICELSQGALKEMIDQTLFAAYKTEDKPELNGGLLEVDSKKLIMVATDGRGMAIKSEKISSQLDEKVELILPAKTLRILKGFLGRKIDTIKIYRLVDDWMPRILFEMDKVSLISYLVRRRFPHHQGAILEKQKSDNELKMRSQELLGALKQARQVCRRIEFSTHYRPDILKVSARNKKQGNSVSVKIGMDNLNGKSLKKRTFDSELLIDFLKVLPSESKEVYLRFPLDLSKPLVLFPTDMEEYRYFCMPIRIWK